MRVHGFGIGRMHDKRCGRPTVRANGAKVIGRLVTDVAGRTGTRAALGLGPGERALPADPGFTFKPHLQWLALRLFRQGDIYRGGEAFFECLLCQRLGFSVLGPHREGAKPERRKLFDDRPLRIGCP